MKRCRCQQLCLCHRACYSQNGLAESQKTILAEGSILQEQWYQNGPTEKERVMREQQPQ